MFQSISCTSLTCCLFFVYRLLLLWFYKVFYCGLFEQFRHFCQMCYAAQKLTECWHRQVDCKTLFFCPAWRLEWNYRNHTISSNLRTCIGGLKDWWAGNSHASSEWGYNFFFAKHNGFKALWNSIWIWTPLAYKLHKL